MPSSTPPPDIMDVAQSLEVTQARHRKEQRDLVAHITQKKKSASKKTRKGVNDECDRLEQELKERQAQELAALGGGDNEDISEQVASEKEDEEDLVDSIAKEVGSMSMSASQPNGSVEAPANENGPKKKPNRAKARLARRAAEQEALVAQAKEEAADMPDLREQERTRMKAHFGRYGLQEKEIRADGHCLFSAVADQMETRGLDFKARIQPQINTEDAKLPPYKTARYAAAEFIKQNPDDFVPFMEEPLDQYLHKIRDTGEWGGHMELLALAKTYGVTINVLQADGRVEKILPEDGGSTEEGKDIWLGYYRHNFGLGEHYNSLRKAP